MRLSDKDIRFINKREQLTRAWPWAGALALMVLAAGATWLWFDTPFFINPWATIEALEQGILPVSTMSIMAVMLPVMALAALVLLIALILVPFAAFANERRLIKIIRRLSGTSPE